MKKLLLIDNYDSFTYNLKALAETCGCRVEVRRNDEIPFETIKEYDGILLSPGPGIPDSAGDLKKIIHRAKGNFPILGICLGMQAIGEVFGATLKLMERPLHGFQTEIRHVEDSLFKGIQRNMPVGRYHSWIVNKESLGNKLEIIASDNGGHPMALKVRGYPIYGVQFHPESVLTPDGEKLMINFLRTIENVA